jgi:hypothetical protein
MTIGISLPRADGSFEMHRLREPRLWSPRPSTGRRRVAYAAAHVVADPLADNRIGGAARLDWEATLLVRRSLWAWGLGVADAMDTAQRGMGLDWPAVQELVRRSALEAAACGGDIIVGAGTDHVPESRSLTLDEVVAAYEEQLEFVESVGVTPVVMASRHLAVAARGADDYRFVYGKLLAQVRRPVLLHWLGEMFDPALRGYWGTTDLDEAVETLLSLLRDYAPAVAGVKVSLLDAAREMRLRREVPEGVLVYTGDDFSYLELIRGDGERHSHALLGAFDVAAPAAATALALLDAGDDAGYEEALAPTVPLSRHLFGAPTPYYKTGITFLAWLNGQQRGFTMVGGLQSGRSVLHLVEAFRLADAAGLVADPEFAVARLQRFLELSGVVR